MNIRNKIMEIVSNWNMSNKRKLIREYGNSQRIEEMSNLTLNEKCAEIIILNLSQEDIDNILKDE